MRFKVFCETDNQWEFFDTLNPKEECPINSAHTVKAGSLFSVGDSIKDYKVMREEFMIYVVTQGFANLSQSEKELASTHFVVSKTDRDSVHTMLEQISNGVEFHRRSVEARHKRRLSAEAEVYNRIQDVLEQADLMNDVTNLLNNYEIFGIEGTVEGDVEGLFDYLESRLGTSYETTGLLSKTYTIEGMTIAELSTRLMDIFKNGNY